MFRWCAAVRYRDINSTCHKNLQRCFRDLYIRMFLGVERPWGVSQIGESKGPNVSHVLRIEPTPDRRSRPWPADVRFTPNSGHSRQTRERPVLTQSGHSIDYAVQQVGAENQWFMYPRYFTVIISILRLARPTANKGVRKRSVCRTSDMEHSSSASFDPGTGRNAHGVRSLKSVV